MALKNALGNICYLCRYVSSHQFVYCLRRFYFLIALCVLTLLKRYKFFENEPNEFGFHFTFKTYVVIEIILLKKSLTLVTSLLLHLRVAIDVNLSGLSVLKFYAKC